MILCDLQESIRKRNPDSVSNLIRAATVSDEVLLERKEQSQLIVDLTAELTGKYFSSFDYLIVIYFQFYANIAHIEQILSPLFSCFC